MTLNSIPEQPSTNKLSFNLIGRW